MLLKQVSLYIISILLYLCLDRTVMKIISHLVKVKWLCEKNLKAVKSKSKPGHI